MEMTYHFVCFALLCTGLPQLASQAQGEEAEIAGDLRDFVTSYGYEFEEHRVVTEDNYILGIHRIPPRQGDANGTADVSPPAVLVMHGLLGCSADWLLTGENRSIAFLLADHGYDVWLGNARGTTASKNHTTLSPSSTEFWDFSWHEIGLYDTPAMIDYILNYTSEKELYYIGFSQGTTQFWVLTSLRPEYNEKIKLMIALAPVAYTGNVQGLLKPLGHVADYTKGFFQYTGFFELLPNSNLMKNAAYYVCHEKTFSQPLCQMMIFLIGGYSFGEFDNAHLVRYLSYSPAGCSMKQLIHYASGIHNPGNFRQYDYGENQNIITYGAAEPPEYPLENIVAPVALYNGQNDWLSHPQDVEILSEKLPNIVDRFTVDLKGLNHFDFLYGKNIQNLVYERVIHLMDTWRYGAE